MTQLSPPRFRPRSDRRTRSRLAALLVGLCAAGLAALPLPARAQGLIDTGLLQIGDLADCTDLARLTRGRESGGQWLIGPDIELYGLPNARRPITRLNQSFERVSCYGQVGEGEAGRVFVATAGGLCGWVTRRALLDLHRSEELSPFERQAEAVCETPRAMTFEDFCANLPTLTASAEAACRGVPRGLRAKGVLMGSTEAALAEPHPFMTAPRGGTERAARLFFSVLEIHDVAPGEQGQVMVLTGDGEGQMFGWIDLEALALWPTRLGLFYDPDGRGAMFQRLRDLVRNWREGRPDPDILAGLPPARLADYIHGGLQLLSYPIIRTVDPARDPLASDPGDTPYHEVIFLGQTGTGSASQLMSQSAFARQVEALQQVNVMIVVDTTESMRPYLPLIRDGMADFIRDYGQRSLDAANRIPDLRLSVVAYSDFLDPARTGPDDPIRTAELMPPTRIGPGFDVSGPLAGITAHPGLDDPVGLREESAIEAVTQLARGFDTGPAWFEDGPRIILHIADHGSRAGVSTAAALDRLAGLNTYYVPIAIVTDDNGDPAATMARERFMTQATDMLAPLVQGTAGPSDVARIDFQDAQSRTPEVVRDQLDLVLAEVVQAVTSLRGQILGDELAQSSAMAQDLAASRVILDERLLADRGLDPDAGEPIVQAATGFAPLSTRADGLTTPIDWTYTVSLEPGQARFLRQNFEAMCGLVGSPEQRRSFRQLIVQLAEAFSGDTADSNADVRAILSDLRALPGADASFLAQSPDVLLARADSTDPAIIDELRRDVCWISYHLGNMDARIYARPDQLQWTGREFALKPGEEVIRRLYRFKPVVGAETVYLPGFFFVLPSIVEDQASSDAPCEFFCN
ncbi:hypothetical protein [Marinibacterium sp. SX1]|uniref:hypothetical protein n=1 Tax=Marinibacterium sp. SX1 TaxID=3388424 RepID=UPI003D1766FF